MSYNVGMNLTAGTEEHTTSRVLAWAWGASLATGATLLTWAGLAGTSSMWATFARTVVTGATLPTLYGLAVSVFDDWRARQLTDTMREQVKQHGDLSLDHTRTQNKLNSVRTFERNEYGDPPLLMDQEHRFVDPVTMRRFTVDTMLERFPDLEQLHWMSTTLRSMRGIPAPAAKRGADLLESGGVQMATLPKSITLARLVGKYGLKPSYHNLVLGETINQDTGQPEPVTGDMTDFVHCIVTGQTGFGKSIALEAMAKQLVLAQDCDLAFVDYGCNTFGMLGQHGLYPIADTPGMAIALFRVLVQEMHRRREKMTQYPQAKTLEQYNELAGDDLRPIVLFSDEASVLFDKTSDLRDLARELTGMGRKFGLGCAFGGTDFKVDVMPSETRGNCGLRMALHLEETGLSRSIIRSVEAVNLVDKGRALARLPGVPGLVEMQTPIVERWDDLPPLQDQVTIAPAEIENVTPAAKNGTLESDQIDQIMDLWYSGMKPTPIARQVFGYDNTRTIAQVRDVIAEYDDNDNNDDGDETDETDDL